MYLAKQATSLDQLSDGRLVVGLSSDDRYSNYPMLGIDYDSRGNRYRNAWLVFRTPPLPPITLPNQRNSISFLAEQERSREPVRFPRKIASPIDDGASTGPSTGVQLRIKMQGCLKDQLCYPPEVRTLTARRLKSTDIEKPRNMAGVFLYVVMM